MEDIKIKSRYGNHHTLKYHKDNLYYLNASNYYRVIYGENPNIIEAVDPDGGPYMKIGDTINDSTIDGFDTDSQGNILIKLEPNEN